MDAHAVLAALHAAAGTGDAKAAAFLPTFAAWIRSGVNACA